MRYPNNEWEDLYEQLCQFMGEELARALVRLHMSIKIAKEYEKTT